jgi:hypothetical protein
LISWLFRRGLSDTLHINYGGGTIEARICSPQKAKHTRQRVPLIALSNLLGYFVAPVNHEYTA